MTQFWDQRFWEKGVKSQFAYIFLFPQFSIFTSCSARASAHHRLVDCNLDHKKSPWRYRFSSSLPAFLACPQFSSYCWMYFYMNFSSLLILDGKWWQFLSGSDYLLRIVTNSTKVLAVLKFFWLRFIKFRFSRKATKFETISHLIWRLLSKCQIKWEIVSNFYGRFRMSEL